MERKKCTENQFEIFRFICLFISHLFHSVSFSSSSFLSESVSSEYLYLSLKNILWIFDATE